MDNQILYSANVVQQISKPSTLASYIHSCWIEAKNHRSKYDRRFRDAEYARRGEYPPDKLARIRAQGGGSVEYARITANKARVLEAWLRDIFLGQEERPWTIQATPLPSLPDDTISKIKAEVSQWLAQQIAAGVPVDQVAAEQFMNERIDAELSRIKSDAELKARRMENKIADYLEEGNFRRAISDFITYLCTYPSAIFKGPIYRQRTVLSWDNSTGVYIPKLTKKIVMEFEAVNPVRCYPMPGATTPQEGYFIEHLTISAQDLYNLIGVEGYDETAIRTVLERTNITGKYLWVSETVSASSDNEQYAKTAALTQQIDVLEFHGPVCGRDLADWGVKNVDRDEMKFYEATVWLVDDIVLKAVLNDDPLGRRPYYKVSYEEVPNEFWGNSLYDVLADVQGVCNAAIRALVNNLAIASGPQVVVNTDNLPPGEDITSLHPWKVWQVVSAQFANNSGYRAIDFFQPNSNAAELLGILEKFYQFADDFSLIPRYMSGSDKISGPARTASGLSMLLDAANKGLKSLVYAIDNNVIAPLLQQVFTHIMLYEPDDTIKGDVQIVARGVASLLQLETLRLRRNEFLQITANPIDSQIVGPQGRAAILREIAKTLGLDVNKIVPPDSVIERQLAQAAAMAGQGQGQNVSVSQGETLMDGRPTTDVASPSNMVS